ncbi:MAG TPA: hypothetical protein DEO84_00755 [candidate division Zixibacteria bacterium]|nr:hypothetical protein [candidate division Zixibacteria bacterium]HBY99824.1 hypothetical protein [candidate division Zixibacteria bacterium]
MSLALLTSNAQALKSYTGFHPANRDGSAKPYNQVVADEPLRPVVLLDSPGRVVGTTYCDFQSNGSAGQRIVIDANGGAHFCWMGSSDQSLSPRGIYYGFVSPTGDSLPAMQLEGRDQAGFAGIDVWKGAINPSVRNFAVLGYHNSSALDDRFAYDSGRGLGVFTIDSSSFPVGTNASIWPTFSIDHNDNIQAVATQSTTAPGEIFEHIYTRKNYGSPDWTNPIVFDRSYTISPVITSSPVSAKTTIAWTRPTYQDSNQYDNDVVYIQSPDGNNWDFAGGRVNITNYPQSVQGDTTIRAYTDVDAVYDYNDNLHIIWNVAYVTRDSANDMIVLYHAALYHWSVQSGIDLIYDHPVREWPSDMGAWNLPVAKMSIGVDDSNYLFVVFTRFDPTDYARYDTLTGDTSPCGGDNAMPCGNGEIYMTYSLSGGNNWMTPVNITNTPSPNCAPGFCDSDNWSSLAEHVDNYLHVLYIDDKDAGGILVQEGDPTPNPVIYVRIANPTRLIGGCNYRLGDINNNGRFTGMDVVYSVRYFKGGPPPPYSCDCPPHGSFFVAGDVNGSCTFNGLDVSGMVIYFKGGSAPVPCPECPPPPR